MHVGSPRAACGGSEALRDCYKPARAGSKFLSRGSSRRFLAEAAAQRPRAGVPGVSVQVERFAYSY